MYKVYYFTNVNGDVLYVGLSRKKCSEEIVNSLGSKKWLPDVSDCWYSEDMSTLDAMITKHYYINKLKPIHVNNPEDGIANTYNIEFREVRFIRESVKVDNIANDIRGLAEKLFKALLDNRRTMPSKEAQRVVNMTRANVKKFAEQAGAKLSNYAYDTKVAFWFRVDRKHYNSSTKIVTLKNISSSIDYEFDTSGLQFFFDKEFYVCLERDSNGSFYYYFAKKTENGYNRSNVVHI